MIFKILTFSFSLFVRFHFLLGRNLTGLHEQEYESERLKESQRLIVISHGEENDEQTQDYSNDQSKETTNPITLPSTGTWHTHSQKYYGTNDRSQDTDSSNPVNASAYSEKDSILHKENKFDAETVWQSVRNVWGRCFQPPVVGSILGIIAAVTPVRGYFVDLVDRSSHAPLQWMFDGLYSVGLTAVPINMIILGCNLSSSYKSSKTEDPSMNLNDGLFTMKTSIGIVIGKMLVLPIIGISSALLLKNYLWVISEDIDDSFYIVIMIVFLCPTANNVMVMVELSGSNAKEGIARVIAMQYAVAPLILSLTMTISIGVASSWS